MSKPEEDLDPRDWPAMRELGRRMVDDALDYLRTVRERPVWQPVPNAVKERFRQPVPREPSDPGSVYEEFVRDVLPYPMGNIHPRFWAWVMGSGTPMGALAEMLAATVNPNMGGGEHGAKYVEDQVLDWCRQMVGFPKGASGLLVSGGSMANLIGLTVARNTKAEIDLRKHGLAAAPHPMVVYASTEVHSSVRKAVELLGLGSEALRPIPVNNEYQIDLDALKATIASDRGAGRHPFCIVGCAGTVNTGAFDDLVALADLARREGLWYHVDGAFGALAAIAPGLDHLVTGMDRADSLALDLHKWLYVPFEAGCVLVRREEDHRRAFSLTPEYLAHAERGLAAGDAWFSDYGVQLTRGFRALKVWMSLKEHGVRKYGRLIRQNVDQAQYLAARVDAEPNLERLADAPLNIVCFRHNPGGLPEEKLNQVNQEIVMRLHESGIAVPSLTTLKGRCLIRVAITNHRSRCADLDVLIDAVKRLAAEV